MLFTVLGRAAATLMLLLAIFRIAVGFMVAGSDDPVSAAARYLGSATSGQAIDGGIELIFYALVLGTLTEISRTLAAARKQAAATTQDDA